MRITKTTFLPLAALLLGALLLALPASAAGPIDSPVDTAETWLDLIDHGSHAVAWELAGSGLKEAARKEDWMRTVAAARLHRGPVLARRLAEDAATDAVAGFPPGEYALVSFETAFGETGDSVESLILAWEGDSWRVIAYFVR